MKKILSALFLVALIVGTVFILSGSKYYTNEGQIFGTTYHITYAGRKNFLHIESVNRIYLLCLWNRVRSKTNWKVPAKLLPPMLRPRPGTYHARPISV